MNRRILLVIIAITMYSGMFAQQTVGLFLNDSLSMNGYTLFAPTSAKNTYLIDNCGHLINSWESNFPAGMSAYLLENGNMLRAARIGSSFNGGGTGGRIQLFNWEGDIIWDYTHSTDTFHQHHDVEYLPNGNILLIAWEKHSREEAIEMGRDSNTVTNFGLWSEQIIELEPVGANEANIVWEWHLWDHLVQDFDSTKANFGVIAEHPELMDLNHDGGVGGNNSDWIHLNSIDYNAELDQIVVSSRHMSEIWIIDHSTTTAEAAGHSGGNAGKGGDILYRWGNPEVYDRGNAGDRRFFGQHDANWIPPGYPGEGQIMVFNNGAGRPQGFFSTVETIFPPADDDGNYLTDTVLPFGPEIFSWTYQASPANDLFSSNISGATRLPNGNTLICEGNGGHLLEVDLTGKLVWEYINPVTAFGPVTQGQMPGQNNVFRTYRYPPDYEAFDGKVLTPGDVLEANPLPSECVIYDSTLVSASGNVQEQDGIAVLGNPFGEILEIEIKAYEPITLEIFDATGKLITTKTVRNEQLSIDASRWSRGIYLFRAFNEARTRYYVQKLIRQ